MKFIKVTDTKGRIWHLNSDWILRISEQGKGTEIEFAIKLRGIVEAFEYYIGMVVKESVKEVEELIEKVSGYEGPV